MPIGEPDNEETILHSALSPDGRLCIKTCTVWDWQAASVPYVCFVDVQRNKNIAVLGHTSWDGTIEASGDSLVLTLNCSGQIFRLMVWSREQTFTLHPHDPPEPLATLPAVIDSLLPKMGIPGQSASGRKILMTVAELCLSLLFVAASLWLFLFKSVSTKERLMSLLGLIFFGACAAGFASELLKLRHWRSR